MKYIINNVKCISDKKLQQKVKKLIRKQTNRISQIAVNYRKPITVNVFFNQIDKVTYQISAMVALRENVIYLQEKDTNIEAGIHRLFDGLKLSIAKKIHKEKRNYLYRRKRTRLKNFHENLNHLKDLRQEQTKDTFKKLSKILIHDISKYIKRRIKTTEITTELKIGKFNVQEVLDELYLLLYSNFEDIPNDIKDINVWLYQKADELLDEKLKEYQFNKDKLVRLDTILEQELKSFDEQFTIDADEEIIPVEELDSYIPKTNEYSIYELLFEEDEESIIDEITLKLNQDKIQKIIHLELAKLPSNIRSIMDLYLIDQLTEEEIAEIKNLPTEKIREIISENTQSIKQSLSKVI